MKKLKIFFFKKAFKIKKKTLLLKMIVNVNMWGSYKIKLLLK